jgi:hypothetical protein
MRAAPHAAAAAGAHCDPADGHGHFPGQAQGAGLSALRVYAVTTARRAAILTLLAILIALALLPAAAQAQTHDCTIATDAAGNVTLNCTPKATATPEPPPPPPPTVTHTPTATPTLTPTTQPTDTPTATPDAALTGNVANVPLLLDARSGDTRLDANNMSIVRWGTVSPAGGYGQLRIIGRAEGVMAYLQVVSPRTRDTVTVTLNGRTYPIAAGSDTWDVRNRCDGAGCRGWTAFRVIPWAELGGAPAEGDRWALTAGEWAGVLRWGLPDYAGAPGQHVVSVPLTADAMTGGGTDCGAPAHPAYFPTWGTLTWGASPYANVQTQWDIADWPCYADYFAAWDMPPLPEGATVTGATLTMHQFGNPGYGPGYAEDGTKDTVIQVYDVATPLDELGIGWDNAPRMGENIARTVVHPIPATCPGAFCDPAIPYAFDVTEAVRRAQADGRGSVTVGLYTAAGQYHSGKYFWSREGKTPPVVTIAYTLPGEDTTQWTPTPTPPPSTATATPVPEATSGAPIASPTPQQTGRTYYISPTGNNTNAGTTINAPLGTFARAWLRLQPGDTLILLDGTYTPTTTGVIQPNGRNGEPGRPITIKALNDGAATIDGQGMAIPAKLGDNWPGPVGDWYVLEGVVLRNGLDQVLQIRGNNNVARRVSVYDGDVNDNTTLIQIMGRNNLVEDVIAAGDGRYMVNVYNTTGNTVRRAFTMWGQWDGRHFCGVTWPNGNHLGVYNSSNTTVENVIAYGRALTGIFIQANHENASANNNAILGSMAVNIGRDYGGGDWTFGAPQMWPTSRPGPTSDRFTKAVCDNKLTNWADGGHRTGFSLWGQGTLQDNVFRDVLAVGSYGLGMSVARPSGPGSVRTVLDHLTLFGNGAYVLHWESKLGGQIYLDGSDVTVTNSRIEGSPWANQGEGARLQYRYVDRVLTDTPLLPWPMEGRARAELGVSVEKIIEQYGGAQ